MVKEMIVIIFFGSYMVVGYVVIVFVKNKSKFNFLLVIKWKVICFILLIF